MGRYETRMARKYMHARRLSECWVGFFCWTCTWRSATGFFGRELARHRRHLDEIRDDIPVIKVTFTDEQKVRGLRGRMLNQMKANGEVLCSTDPSKHGLRVRCGWPCPDCGAAV